MNVFLGAALAVVGVAVVGWAIVIVAAQWLFDRRSAQATGTVIALEAVGTAPSGFSEIGKTYRPVVSFVDQDGKRVDFTSPDGYAPPRHRPGGTVDVDYDPKRPDQARLAGSGVGLLPLGCVALGLVAFALSAVLFLVPT
ncbi:MAG: DUF3592 domain-containing protein [Actinomycetota bacterium]|nr:DUF3592 domain-containing protein [Actinomycetota bacterium]